MAQKPNNPFVLTGYHGSAYFCDREAELDALRDHIANDRNVVLYAWRRLGKTVMLKRFLELCEKELNMETLYVDLLATRDEEGALRQLGQAVIRRYGNTSRGLSGQLRKVLGQIGIELSFDPMTGMPTLGVGLRNETPADASLQILGEYLSSRKKGVLVVLDEFQQITHYEGGSAEAIFRKWMQSFPDIQFIYSGSHRHMMESMFAEANRPFYRSAQLVSLGPIALQAYESFIKSHFKAAGKTIDAKAIEGIYKWSRGQTYAIQLQCNKLYGAYNGIKGEHITSVQTEILAQEGPVFAQYTRLLSRHQWELLRAIAREDGVIQPMSKDFIEKYKLGAASTVNSALKMLVQNEIVVKDDGVYLVHDLLLSRWLQTA